MSYNPAPEGVQVSSPSHTSMDVHVGSSPPRSDGVMAMHASLTSSERVALEVGEPDARILISASGAESTPDNVLQIVLVDLPSSSYNIASHDLGLPSFFLSAFRPRGVPGPTSKLSPRVLAQMGRRETEHEGGKKQAKGETHGLRVALRPGRVRLQ
jgi:hypothetical protein